MAWHCAKNVQGASWNRMRFDERSLAQLNVKKVEAALVALWHLCWTAFQRSDEKRTQPDGHPEDERLRAIRHEGGVCEHDRPGRRVDHR